MPLESNDTPIAIACGLDDRFGMALAVTLSSLFRTLTPGRKVVVFVLSMDIATETKRRLRACATKSGADVELIFVDVVKAALRSVPTSYRLSAAAYLRILLPDLLPAHYDKILYLDSDLLVRKDVGPLFDLNVERNLLLAAWDPIVRTVSNRRGLYNWRDLGFDEGDPYFNSGVLLMNLKQWRLEGTGGTVLNYIHEHREKIKYHDQEALNAVCMGRWKPLDMTWNSLSMFIGKYAEWNPSMYKDYVRENFDSLRYDPAITHFAAVFKPWLPGFRPPFLGEWLKCLKTSGWFSSAEYYLWYFSWFVKHVWRASVRKALRQKAVDRD